MFYYSILIQIKNGSCLVLVQARFFLFRKHFYFWPTFEPWSKRERKKKQQRNVWIVNTDGRCCLVLFNNSQFISLPFTCSIERTAARSLLILFNIRNEKHKLLFAYSFLFVISQLRLYLSSGMPRQWASVRHNALLRFIQSVFFTSSIPILFHD